MNRRFILPKALSSASALLGLISMAFAGPAAAQIRFPVPGPVPPPTRKPTYFPVNVTTYQNDVSRTGQNLNESILTPANVASGKFGELYNKPLGGADIYGQPLYLSNFPIWGQGYHNVLIVGDASGVLYALDADTGATLWADGLGPSVGSPNVPPNPQDIAPQEGITGTPVVNAASGLIYVCVKNFFFGQILVQIDAHTGNITNEVSVGGRIEGSGDGSQYGWVYFNSSTTLQRSALLLANGSIYVTYATDGSQGDLHGWIFRFDARSLKSTGYLCTTPNGVTGPNGIAGGGVWMGGSGPAADQFGHIFAVSGSGTFDGGSHPFPYADYAGSVLKLSTWTGFKLTDYFTPFDESLLQAAGLDQSSGGITLLPPEMGVPGHPSLLATVGSDGTLYLLDQNNLGKFNAASDQVVQELFGAVPGGEFGAMAYCNGILYAGGTNDFLRSFAYVPGTGGSPVLTQVGQSPNTFDFPGVTPTISGLLQNGVIKNEILWALDTSQFSNPNGQSVLFAYDPVTLQILYTSFTNDENAPAASAFTLPTVANGKVFVASAGGITAYGLK